MSSSASGGPPGPPPAPVIQRHLSEPRLRPYLEACGEDLPRAVGLYRWNARVAAAFWEVLGHGEVVLRNAIHDALTDDTAATTARRRRGILVRRPTSGTRPAGPH